MLGLRADRTTTVLAVVFLAASGSLNRANVPQKTGPSTAGRSPEPSGIAARFVGTEWNLTSLYGHDLSDGTSITLEIDSNGAKLGVGGSAGCNEYGTFHATMQDGVYGVRPESVTEVGCPGKRSEQEKAYLNALDRCVAYQEKGALEVQDPGGRTTLVYGQEELSSSNP